MAESPEFDVTKDPNSFFAPKHERIAGLLQYLGPTHVENENRKENSQSVDSDSSFDSNEHLTDVRVPIRKHLLFGRSQEKCDVVFNNLTISKVHCRIYVVQFDPLSAPMVYCQDTSLNSTYLNDVPIGFKKAVLLSHFDTISIGEKFEFRYIENIAYHRVRSTMPELHGKTFGKFVTTTRVLGRGGFGEVLLAIDSEKNEHIACKASKKTNKQSFQPATEVKILESLHHPNILSVYETHFQDDRLFIFEELLTGGDLFSYLIGPNDCLRPLKESEVLFITYQILGALQYLHQMNIAHRDLKLDNVLMESPFPGSRIVLGDFGIAKSLNGTRSKMSTVIGTPEYCAPEVGFSEFRSSTDGYSLKCDMWSLGVIIHILFTGISPFFDERDAKQTAINASNGILHMKTVEWQPVSRRGKDFVCQLLQVNPDNRLSAVDCFRHEWIRKCLQSLESLYKEKIYNEWLKKNTNENSQQTYDSQLGQTRRSMDQENDAVSRSTKRAKADNLMK